MKNRFRGPTFWLVVLAFSAVALAQRPAQPQTSAPAKPTPRTADGKPDLSGTWTGGARPTADSDKFAVQTGGEQSTMQLTKWGEDKFRWNRGPESANAPGVYRGQGVRVENDPVYNCYPLGLVRLGPPAFIISGGSGYSGVAVEIIQTPEKVMMVYEYRNSIRRIYTDGRDHPENLELTWNGHSIGKWDGDTLVVDTIGLRDESWLDTGGHEHSAELHVVERFRRLDEQTLEIQRTLTDPIALAKPFKTTVTLQLRPDLDIHEARAGGNVYDCTQFMVRKPAFGEGMNDLLGIGDHP